MAERSTAALGVAETSGEDEPLTAHGDGTGADGAADQHNGGDETPADTGRARPDEAGTTGDHAEAGVTGAPEPPELHSGHKLARRYRLEECVTRLEGFSSWRAVDEKLRRAVGVHLISSGHPRAHAVLSAARSAALLADPRFVQVLDAVEEGELVYVVHEWLPDAKPLSDILPTAALEAHEAYQLVSQLSQAMTSAHREGLAHLQLTPGTVLRTGSGQYRVRGLAVNAALRGITSDTPQRDDTEAIGALLYASLSQRWPYEEDAYGLPGVGSLSMSALAAPDQVRAGVHRGLSQLAMRALMNDGATASRHEQPCATPEELQRAVAAMPRIRPPEPTYTAPSPYQRTTYQQGAYAGPDGNGAPAAPATATARAGAEPPAPPTLPGRTGKVLKWGVSALLIAALGLGSWQVADTLLKGDTPGEGTGPAQAHEEKPTGKPVDIVDAKDFDPEGDGSENAEDVPDAYDKDPATYWLTNKYYGRPDFGNLKSGVGLILDLGKQQQVSEVKIDFLGKTSADLLAAPKSTNGMPTTLGGFSKVDSGSAKHLTLKAKKPVTTQYVMVWLTELPQAEDGNYRGRISEIEVRS
ncbi:protein kinase family protein [Streptomyces sp. HNM0574]|uniref:protein kinase family protein n=1 Tax=Streptomyces sp. HNM0574 TaxID=2714954 RepID=UPI00146F02C4|nr:serine/threonine protein kinase [Streptomyces sp. HNM0574]